MNTILTAWKPIILLIISAIMNPLFAQFQNGYTLVGSAHMGITVDCIELTSSSNGQTGAIWFDKQINLAKSFTLTFTINLGSNPAGADGIVMVFQTQGNQVLGGQAGGIGYKSLRPSLGVEFDTNQNFELGDPAEDHIALVRNGESDHRLITDLAAPIPILTTQNTVKDGRDHTIKVYWDARTHTIRVEVDCVSRINQTIDLVNTIFSGTSEVIWGFTSATGVRGNVHTICISREEDQPDTIQVCRNDQITLLSPVSSNGQYLWAPSAGLNDSHMRTLRLKVNNSQLYTVQYFDLCAQPKLDSVFVHAKGTTLSIGDDRQVCENDTITLAPALIPTSIPITYRWSTGQTTPQLKPTTSGQYSLTITADGCSVSDSAIVTFNPRPRLGLSTEPTYDCLGNQSIQLDPQATGTGLQYSWTPVGSKEPTLMADTPGKYAVTITTPAGCTAIQGFTILNNCPSIQIFVPDAFTPNGDGVNDILKWQGGSNLEARMKVFDRWGEIVFISTASSLYWDGTYQGKPCPPAAYTWNLYYWTQLTTKQPGFTMWGKVLLLK